MLVFNSIFEGTRNAELTHHIIKRGWAIFTSRYNKIVHRGKGRINTQYPVMLIPLVVLQIAHFALNSQSYIFRWYLIFAILLIVGKILAEGNEIGYSIIPN